MSLYTSGVHADLVDRTVTCDVCDAVQEIELAVDPTDFRTPLWACLLCGHTNDYVEPEPDDDQLLAYWRI